MSGSKKKEISQINKPNIYVLIYLALFIMAIEYFSKVESHLSTLYLYKVGNKND